jgi:predicted lysophospholipase L1 biosynthesis ABC-type transport system permease subunit
LPVAIVNEAFAGRFWPGQNPLHRTFRAAGTDWTIIGVAKTGKYRHLAEAPWPVFYVSYLQRVPDLDLSLCLRTRDDPQRFVETVRREVRKLDSNLELRGTTTMIEHCQGALFGQRIASDLLNCLGLVVVVLAALGVYGVVANTVSRRTHEFGIRFALGAQRHTIWKQVLGQGLGLSAIGTAAGLVLAAGMTRLLGSFLFGISPFDWVTFAAVPVFLAFIVLLACWLPAFRASKVDPIIALRSE